MQNHRKEIARLRGFYNTIREYYEKQSETVGKTKSCTRKPRSKYEAGYILARILSKQ